MRLSEAILQPSVSDESVKSYRLSDVMALEPENIEKNKRGFWANITESYARGSMAADIDQAGFLARNKELDFDKDVRPLVEEQQRIAQTDPIEGENFVSSALYKVAEMAPAMLTGIIEGKTVGALAASGAALTVPVAVPGAFLAGDVAGAFNYWRRQGAGALYIDMQMQEEPLDDSISIPLTEIGGSLYGAIEFSQIDKLIPGSKEVTKRLVSDTLKKTIMRFAGKYGMNWATEVGEEGLQEIVTETTKEVGNRIAGQTNENVGRSVERILMRGWEASKESALPMLLLMGPGGVVEGARIAEFEKIKEAHREETAKKALEIAKEVEILQAEADKGVTLTEEIPAEPEAVELAEVAPVEPIPTEDVSRETLKEEADKAPEVKITPENIKPKKKTGLSLLDEKIAKLEEQKGQLEAAKGALEYVKSDQKELTRRISPYKDGALAEEYAEIPAKYKTKEGGITMDQAAAELRDRWIDVSEATLSEYLKNLDAQSVRLKKTIAENKPEIVKMRKMTELKKRVSDIKKGIREGKFQTKKEISELQKEFIGVIKDASLTDKNEAKFIPAIARITSREKMAKEMEKFVERATKYIEGQKKDVLEKIIKTELKRSKPLKKGKAKAVGRYDYESNKLFEDLRDYAKMTKGKAMADFLGMPKEGLNEADLVRKRMLSLKANGRDSSVAMYERVLSDIQRMKEVGGEAKDDADFIKKMQYAENVEELKRETEKVKESKKTVKNSILNSYRLGFSNIWSMLNSTFGKKIADKYNPEGFEQDKVTAKYKRNAKKEKAWAKIYNVDVSEIPSLVGQLSVNNFKIVDNEGRVREISKMDIMDIHNAIKDEHTKERYFDLYGQGQVLDLLTNLTEDDISVSEWLMEDVKGDYQVLNEFNIEQFGVDLGRMAEYWPRSSRLFEEAMDQMRGQSEIPSSIKQRSAGGVYVFPSNAWMKHNRAVDQAEHVRHLTRAYKNLRNLFTNIDIEFLIKNKYGDDIYKTLLDQIETISINNNDKALSAIDKAFNWAFGNWVLAKIANPSVMIKQLVSAGNYAENMPAGEWVSGFFEGLSDPKKTFDFMWKNNPFLESRFNRGYSEASQDAIRNAESLGRNMKSWANFLSVFGRSGDITAIIYGGYPLMKHEMRKNKKTAKQASEIFRAATLRSQQSGLSSSRSAFQNSKNPFARIFFAFKNTSTQYLRKMIDANVSYLNGDISKRQWSKTMFIYGLLNPILFGSVSPLMKRLYGIIGQAITGDEPEDELGKKIAESIILQVATNPTNAIPVINDAWKFGLRSYLYQSEFEFNGEYLFENKPWSVFSTPMIDDLEVGLKTLTKEDKEAEDYLKIMATILEPTTATPANKILRIKETMFPE